VGGKSRKNSVIPKDNIQLGIEHRQYVTQENKVTHLDGQTLTQISDPYVQMSLRLQQTFGLRHAYAQIRYEALTG